MIKVVEIVRLLRCNGPIDFWTAEFWFRFLSAKSMVSLMGLILLGKFRLFQNVYDWSALRALFDDERHTSIYMATLNSTPCNSPLKVVLIETGAWSVEE
ncbi:MAG TPA: hypothetical protein VFU37_05340 [Pyrinomonadaceae bacterium]|nr:hypothetical protein [Pyrinomonadaceae bacterium]